MRLRFHVCLTFFVIALSLPQVSADDGKASRALAKYYGFEGLEIFKLARRSANMLAGDFNDDDRLDLILADNSNSRIDMLLQRADGDSAPAADDEINAVENDWRFEHKKLAVDKQIAAMATGDFNGDGRRDIAYLGVPEWIVVRFQPPNGEPWSKREAIRLPGLMPSPWSIAGGDLNSDGRDDLIALGKTATYVLYQKESGEFDGPRRLMNTSQKLGLATIADMDGDGRNDLCYLVGDGNDGSICARLQQENKKLGPELRFDLEQPRGVTWSNLDGQPGLEVLSIEAQTNRVKVSQLRPPESKRGELPARLIQYGFGETGSGKSRDLAVGDVDGDGKQDVVVTDPNGAQMIVYRQQDARGLDTGSTYPGLLGTEHVRVANLDGDAADEVVVLSTKEKAIALSQFADGRLSFPTALPLADDAEPLALEVADLNDDDSPEVIYAARHREGRASKYKIHALQKSGNTWEPYSFGDETEIELELSSSPEQLVRLDANKDGHPDLLVFFDSGKPPLVLTSDTKGSLTPRETKTGFQLGAVPASAIMQSDREDAAVLVSQKTFARSLQLGETQWEVLDQYNASESAADIAGAAEINLDGEEGVEIVLIDRGVKRIRVLRQEENVYRPWREVELGTFSFRSTRVDDFNGDGEDDLLLFGNGRFAVLYTGRTDPVLREVASFETDLKRAFFSDLTAGDLNGDGAADLAVMDTRTKFIEVLNFDRKNGMRHATHFKVFEEKSFTRERGSGIEPRELMIADFTGDGRADLVLLAHDRVLLYPQDAAVPGD